jgi:hypothetical protein
LRFDATTLWHFDAAEWVPSTTSKAEELTLSICCPLYPESRHSRAISASPLGANNGRVAFDRSRLKTGPAASLTLNFLVTFFEKTFAFAILAFHFWLAGILLHVLSKSNAVGNPRQRP